MKRGTKGMHPGGESSYLGNEAAAGLQEIAAEILEREARSVVIVDIEQIKPRPRPPKPEEVAEADWERYLDELEAIEQEQAAKLAEATQAIEARKAERSGPERIAELARRVKANAEFWEDDRTEMALKQLDIWATWWRVRKLGLLKMPTAEAIFEKPVKNLPWFRMTPDGPWQTDWNEFRQDQNPKLKSPEELVALSVNLTLICADDPKPADRSRNPNGTLVPLNPKRRGWLRYTEILLLQFPRSGPYQAVQPFDAENKDLEDADRAPVRRVARLLRQVTKKR